MPREGEAKRSAAKKPAARKPAAAKTTAAKKKPPPSKQPASARKPKTRPAKKPVTPTGPRLQSAQMAARDSMMIARIAQGWTWETIAAEAGIGVQAAQKAVIRRREMAPIQLQSDPAKIIEDVMQGFLLSITDLEAMAGAALEQNNVSSAVGAKKGANEAREKVVTLLQATGRLPHELGALRHLIDLRAIAVRMLDSLDDMEREMHLVLRLNDDEERREAAKDAVSRVRLIFNDLIGISTDEGVVDGQETPALPAG